MVPAKLQMFSDTCPPVYHLLDIQLTPLTQGTGVESALPFIPVHIDSWITGFLVFVTLKTDILNGCVSFCFVLF